MSDAAFAHLPHLPDPPYDAVIFPSCHTSGDAGYDRMAARMVELAAQQPGFWGVESARDAEGFGISVSYWATEEAIAAWRRHAEHRIAQEQGRTRWYAHYELRAAKVGRAHAGSLPG